MSVLVRRVVRLIVPVVLMLVCLVVLPPVALAEPSCTKTWVGTSEENWRESANWSPAGEPSASDVVCIGAGKVANIEGGERFASVVQGEGQLNLNSGTLEVGSATEASVLAKLKVAGGTLTGAATVKVSSTLTWTSGEMSGSGKTILLSGATGRAEGSLRHRTLVNEGTLSVEEGQLGLYGAIFENKGTFKLNTAWPVASGESPNIINTGLFERAVTGTGEVEAPLENHGTVDALAGTLKLKGGGSSNAAATWLASEGAKVYISSSISAYEVSESSISGTMEIEGGTTVLHSVSASGASLIVNTGGVGSVELTGATMTVASLSLNGNIRGETDLHIGGSLTWAGGSMEGKASTVLEPGSTGAFGGSSSYSLDHERTLRNEGSVTLGSEGQLFLLHGAVLENLGTITDNQEFPVVAGTSPEPAIINSGTFRKTAGEWVEEIQPLFENSGIVYAEVGSFKFAKRLEAGLPAAALYGGPGGPSLWEVPCPTCGEPVVVSTGDLVETQTDLTFGGLSAALPLTRTYNSQAASKEEKGDFGYGWSASYNAHLSVESSLHQATLHEPNGGKIVFAESGGSFTAPAWSQDKLSGSIGTGYTVMYPDQRSVTFNGLLGRLEEETDRNGNVTQLFYVGNTTKIEFVDLPGGERLTYHYNGENLIENVEGPAKRQVKYTYEGGKLASVTLPGEVSARWKFAYDGSRQLTEMTDGLGHTTLNEYNASGQVVKQTDPLGHVLTFGYTPYHTRVTNEATSAVTDYYFTDNNEPSAITRGAGTTLATTETFAYNSALAMTRRTDGNGHTTTYGYDSEENRELMVDPNSNETKWGYDAKHDVTSTTTPNGETTTIKRDSKGNAETVERPAPGGSNQTTKYAYTAKGEVESVTDPLEHVWKYSYDTNGNRASETDPAGDKRTWEYDKYGFATSTVSPRGNAEGAEAAKYTTKIKRDEQERPTKITDPLKHATEYAYDASGNLKELTDANKHTTKYTYNADNEPTKVEAPKGNTTETEYDGEGHVTAQIDGNKHITRYVRNILGQVKELEDPLKRKTTKEYDAAGNVAKVTDPTGRTTTYVYDAANRLKEVKYSEEATPSVKYEYDNDGNRTTMEDGSGTTTYTYDQLDRLEETKDGHGDIVKYEYDLANQQTKITYPNAKAVTRKYDSTGRLEKVTDWLEHTTSFGYDADSNLTTTTFPSNEDKYAYNEADQQTSTEMKKGAETLATLTYERDKDGQLTLTKQTGLPGAAETKYKYDEDNRLTEAGTTKYEYDAANNPTKTGSSTNTYDAASQLEKGTGLTYTYNELGERTKRTPTEGQATTYGYDQAGNLTGVEKAKEGETPAIEDTYTYGGDGLRVSQTITGITTHLTWALAGSLPLLLNDETQSFIYGANDIPIEQVSSGGAVLFLHHDQQGSSRMLTSTIGAKEASSTYDAYGNTAGTTGTATTTLGYDGESASADTGLIYLRARTYDPATAQFLNMDPALPITRAPYTYASDDPLNLGDPRGLGNWLNLGIPSPGEAGHAVLKGGETLLHAELDVLAVQPYALYYGAFELGRAVNYLGEQFGLPGEVVSHFAALPAAQLEALGLAGDGAIDAIKSLALGHESVCDEGKVGYINPLHGFVPGPLKGPAAYLPGVHENGEIDFEW